METKKYPLSKTLKRMLANVWKENKKLFGRVVLYMIIAGIYPFFAVVLPKLLIGVLETNGTNVEDSIKQVVMIVGGFFILAGAFGFLQAYIHDADYNKISRLRLNCLNVTFTKLLTMDYKYREDAQFLDQYNLAFESTSSNDNGVEGIYHKLYDMPAGVVSILILALLIGWKNPLILLGILLNIMVGLLVEKTANGYQYSMREEEGKAHRRKDYYYKTTYDFAYGKDLRLFGFEKRIIDNYNFEISQYVKITRLVQNKQLRLGVWSLLAALVSDALTYGLLIVGVIRGMSIADFSMYLSAVITLTTLLITFSKDVAFVYKEGLYVEDFYRFIDADLGTKGGDREALAETLEVEFRNVTFRYPGTEKDIFKNLNFTIHKGEKLAIVGINGAGKSTLVKLMTGLFEPTEGEILINDIPQKEFDKQEYFKMFSVVFQDAKPIAFTIGENVSCASDDIQTAQILNCLERVGLGDKVKSFDKGLDQMMLKIIDENGTQFSGGESQKLMIARALYKDANMVILDEPTAALDALAEAEIYKDFDDLVAGKTSVYISHRLSSTKFCDKIALFDGNGLAEYGNHDELMELRGEYYHMFSVQGKYYKEESLG